MPGYTVLHYLPKFVQIHSVESVMLSNSLILCHPLLLLPSIFLSIRLFSSELSLRIRWPEYWSFSFSLSPSNEYSRLISLRIDWFDLLAVQGILKSLLQQHSSILGSVQFGSVAQSCPTLCNPMNRSTPGLPVHHQLLEFTQTHVHRVSDAIQPSHPLLSPSPPDPNPSHHQVSNESTLCMRWPKYWSFSFSISPSSEIHRTDLLYDGLIGSP